MTFEVPTLSNAIERLGNLESRDLVFLTWIETTKQCKPVVRPIRIVFPKQMRTDVAIDIITAMNSKAWIVGIMDEHKNLYRIKDAEDFAKKSCEVEENGKRTKN